MAIRNEVQTVIFSEKHKKGLKILLFAYIIFAGCFSFPIHSKQFSLTFMRVYLFIAQYGIIGSLFAGLYGEKKGVFVYISTLIFTISGLGCRYLLEFGEISNTYNFTLSNIIEFIVIIPIAVLIVYYVSPKITKHKKE